MANPRGNPQNLIPFKPGQSGNPSGRPKRRPISDAYEAVADLPLPEDLRAKLKLPKGAKYRDAVALRQFQMAIIKGNSPAAKEIREAIEGKATQRVELVGGEDAPPIGITYELVEPPKPRPPAG
jgi:hypothetical protein